MKNIFVLIVSLGIILSTLIPATVGYTNPDSVGTIPLTEDILRSKAAFAVVEEEIARRLNLRVLSEWDYQKLRGPVLWKIRAPIHFHLRKQFGRIVHAVDFGASVSSGSLNQTPPLNWSERPSLHKRAAEIIRDFIDQEHISVIIRSNVPIGIGEIAAIRRSRGEVRYTYELINGACVVIPIKSLAALIRQPFITEMWPDSKGNLETINLTHIGAIKVHSPPPAGLGVMGMGVHVAVVDGGIDGNHSEFKNRIKDTRGVPFSDVLDRFKDATNHGTHVAGIIGAALDTNIFTGVAPKVELLDASYATSGWLKIDDILSGEGNYGDAMDAINWAAHRKRLHANRKADVINMSLGWPIWVYGRNGDDPMSELIDKIIDEAGIVFVKSAGNDAQRRDVGSISSNPDPIKYNTATHRFSVNHVNASGGVRQEVDVYVKLLWSTGTNNLDLAILHSTNNRVLTGSYAPATSNGRESNGDFYEQINFKSQLTPGSNTSQYRLRVGASFNQVQNLQKYEVWVSKGSEFDSPDPTQTVSIPGYSKKAIAVGAVDVFANVVTDFSSQGSSDTGLIKPEVVAPGQFIASTFKSSYGTLSGTSMAAPHVAGVAALILDAVGKNDRGEWNFNPDEVKSAIVYGAKGLTNIPDNTYGAGLVRADNIIFGNEVPANGRLRFEIKPRLYDSNYGNYRLNADPYLVAAISWENPRHDLDLVLSDAANGRRLPMVSQVALNSAKIGGNEFILPNPGATYFLDVINRSQEAVAFTGAATHKIEFFSIPEQIPPSTIPTQRKPEAINTIPLQTLLLGASPETVDVARYFSSQNDLIYEAESNPRDIVTESVSGSRVTISPRRLGSTSVIVTARDSDNMNLYAVQTIPVLVYTDHATIVRPSLDPTFRLPMPTSPVGLKIGNSVITQLTPGFTLAVRPVAGTNNIPRERIGNGITGTIERGPRSNEGFTWWYIEWDIRGQNLEGWSVEADRGQILFRRPPDLEIQDLDVSENAVEPGEAFKIEVRVRNNGPGESAPTEVYFYYSPNRHSDLEELDADGDNLRVPGEGTLKVPSLREGSSREVSLSVEAPMTPDRYYYGAILPSNIHDTDYTDGLDPDVIHNNFATEARVEVTSSPDLIVESISANKSTVDPDEAFRLEATVRNQGIGEPKSNAKLRYYRSTTASISDSDTEVGDDTVTRGNLDTNGTGEESISLTAPSEPGIYYYGACVARVEDESNSRNNCSSAVVITVRAPESDQTPDPIETPDPPDLIIEPPQQPAQTAGAIYWTDWDTNKIQRANLNGSNVEDLVTTGLISPYGIVLDIAGGKMYWTDAGAAKIQRANLNGSNIQDLIPLGLGIPICIALDLTSNKMYWTDRGTGKIQRANLDGSNVQDLVFGVRGLHGIALDIAGGKMYWTDNEASKIQRANLNGTTIEDLVTTGLQLPNEIALDVAGGKMYWVDDGTRKIQRANLNGTSVQDLVTTGLHTPVGITLDSIGDKMYWTDLGTRKIQRANLNGTSVQDLVTTGLNAPFGITLGTSLTFSLPVVVRADVNSDGVVDAQDVVLVDQKNLDLNDDGVSDIADILLVVEAIGNAGGAPAARLQFQHLLTAERVQQWLIEAELLDADSPTYRRGILVLEQLLTLLAPGETALLPNYPNPFNPETWIPYQIAEPANVTVHIYATNGHLVRTLRLGHQQAGIYHNRNRAAYWDGQNELGEPVASGIYFYTLSAGNFTATRKMLVEK